MHFKEGIHFARLNGTHTRLKLFDRSDMPLDKLESHLVRSLPRQLRRIAGNAIARVVEYHYPAELWDNLFQDLQTLRCEVGVPLEDAC